MRNIFACLVLVALATFITGCGGGGSGETPAMQPPTPSSAIVVNGVLFDTTVSASIDSSLVGPRFGAFVMSARNRNGTPARPPGAAGAEWMEISDGEDTIAGVPCRVFQTETFVNGSTRLSMSGARYWLAQDASEQTVYVLKKVVVDTETTWTNPRLTFDLTLAGETLVAAFPSKIDSNPTIGYLPIYAWESTAPKDMARSSTLVNPLPSPNGVPGCIQVVSVARGLPFDMYIKPGLGVVSFPLRSGSADFVRPSIVSNG